jgi:hypothetical protein
VWVSVVVVVVVDCGLFQSNMWIFHFSLIHQDSFIILVENHLFVSHVQSLRVTQAAQSLPILHRKL